MAPSLPRIAADALRGGRTHRYADHRQGVCELHLPAGPGPHPAVIVVHGGSWKAGFDRRVMRPVCRDLVRRGWAAWNVEYRRMGGGQDGGAPSRPAEEPDVRPLKQRVAEAVRAVERQALLSALAAAGSPTRAAEALGISRASFYQKLKEHGLPTG